MQILGNIGLRTNTDPTSSDPCLRPWQVVRSHARNDLRSIRQFNKYSISVPLKNPR